MKQISVGDIVETRYNSGTYIGEVLNDRQNFYLVKVLAVVAHPTQGDLHNRGKVEGVAFFERKALGYQEKMNATKRNTIAYDIDVPNYQQSLQKALEEFKTNLSAEDTAFNRASLEKLADLQTHYYDKILNGGNNN